VQPGDEVDAGDPVGIVEAMKLFNQIKAPEKGCIKEVLVNHGDSVRKGQPLMVYEPA
jgi:acetyl-CoA carboxylase biotin carboxyl carrier protein